MVGRTVCVSVLYRSLSSKPIALKQYWLPGGHTESSQIIKQLLEAGVSGQTPSPFNSPIWPVKKPDGSWGMTVDYQFLNKATPPMAAVLPDIVTLLHPVKVTGR